METQTAEPIKPQQASAWEDFVDVFLSPGEMFSRRANSGFGMAFLVLSIATIVLYYGFPSVNHAFAEVQITASLAKHPERAAAVQARGGDPAAGWKFFGIFAPVGLFVTILVTAFVTWVAAKIASVALSFKQSMMLNTWVAYLFIVMTLVTSVLALLKVNRGETLDPIKDRSLGILRFMDTATTPAWQVGLLSRIDVFAIWQLILTAVAVAAITKCSKGNAYIVAAIVWLFGALPILLAAAFA